MYETLRYEESGDIATITLARAGGNRISMRMVKELSRVCDHLEDESQAKAVSYTHLRAHET